MRRFSLLVFVCLFVSAAFAQSAWVALGPEGGDARSLAYDPKNPDRVFAGTSTGELFVSTDFGKSWKRFARIGKGDDYVLDNISINPQNGTIYVATWTLTKEGGGVYRSTDDGKTWTALNGMQGKSIRAMALAPSDPKLIVVGALDGVFRSRDGGDSWERISPGNYAELKNVESIAIDPANPEIIYAGTWHLPWKTEDGGKSWNNIKNGVIDDSDVFSIIVDPKMPSVVYASACSGIYKSENSGALFRKVQGIPYTARRTRVLLQDPIRQNIVYAGTTEGLWRTADSGKNWQMLTTKNVIVNDVLIDPRNYNHVLLATDRSGILYSANEGESFTPSNDGYSHRQVATLVVSNANPNRLYAGVLNDKEYGGVFVSNDAGAKWQQISAGLNGRDVFVLREVEPERLIAGTNSGIFERTGSNAWRPLNDVVTETVTTEPARKLKSGKRLPAKKIVKTSRSTLEARVNDLVITQEKWLAATTAGLYESTDRGKAWRPVLVPGIIDVLSVASHNDELLVAGQKSLRVSNDGGKNWSERQLPNITQLVSVAIAPDESMWAAGLEGAFRSTDHGTTWKYIWSLPAKHIAYLGWDPGLHRIVATGVDSTDLYESKDGNTWTTVPAGWLLRRVVSSNGRNYGATAFDGVVVQPGEAPAIRVGGK